MSANQALGRSLTSDPPPDAPGSLEHAPTSDEILRYLEALTAWRDRLRVTLDHLDERARVASAADHVLDDVLLAFSLWQSIAKRIDEIVTAWDSGRVGDVERDHIATLVWGRLGSNVDMVLTVSFVEACVLADALVARLRARLDADPLGAPGVGDRVGALRAQIARCRDHDATGAATVTIDALRDALEQAIRDASSGADRRGELERIDREASALERDLIIESAARASSARDRARLQQRLATALDDTRRLRDLATACREKIVDPPRLAIPDPAVLGPVPLIEGGWREVREALAEYEDRMDDVERALSEAHRRYDAPLARRSELRGLLDAYRAMAASRGLAEDLDLATLYGRVRTMLWTAPLDLAAAEDAVAEYERAVRAAVDAADKNKDSNREGSP